MKAKEEEPEDELYNHSYPLPSSPSPSPVNYHEQQGQNLLFKQDIRPHSPLPPPRRSVPPSTSSLSGRSRVKRVNLDEDEPIWSTIPSRKKPKLTSSASDRLRKGVVTTSRFTLPVIKTLSIVADKDGAGEGGAGRKVKGYRPPPKEMGSSKEEQDEMQQDHEPGADALGWKVVTMYP